LGIRLRIYKLFIASSKTEKLLKKYLEERQDIKNKLDRLKENPYREMVHINYLEN